MTMLSEKKKITVGIDVGAESTKIVLGSSFSCEIVRSDAGLHTTPTAVSFNGKFRNTGETANQKSNQGIIHLNRLLNTDTDNGDDFLSEFYMFSRDKDSATNNQTVVTVDYNGDAQKQFSSSAVLAMLLGKISQSVMATIQRMQSTSDSGTVQPNDVQYLLSVAPGNTSTSHEQLLDAAYCAGLENAQIVESPIAYASAYHRKFPEVSNSNSDDNGEDGNGGKVVLIVDMGHAQTSVSVVKFGGGAAADAKGDGEEKTEESKEETATTTTTPPFQVLATKSHSSLGAASLDVRLWRHFQSTMPKLAAVKPKSRAGQRLLQGTHKLKHLLSQLPEGSVTVENVGENDTDVVLTATRTTLADLCDPDAKALTELIQSTLTLAGDDAKVTAVEVLGGGCRIPWVQSVIQQVVGGDDLALSRSLDDTSAALGAALVGEEVDSKGLVVDVPAPSEEVLQRRQKLREEELAMAALDLEETAKADIRNRIEARVLELRAAKHGKHGALLPSGEELDTYLNELDDWLFSEEADNATLAQMEAKENEMETKTKELCADYYAAIQKEQEAKEKEMEEEAKKAQQEANANGGGDDEDHDNRRLPKKRRMEIVMKNKEEANELFKDGNWRFAAARYTKALTHCAKFVDLGPDDVKEVNDLKVTLNLNLALAYMKMSNVDQALRVCNEALSLDDSSAKAYYRRASVYYEKKRWDDAKKDITNAKKLAENDKAIQKLGERIDLQLKKQKQKEKKMASKMFG